MKLIKLFFISFISFSTIHTQASLKLENVIFNIETALGGKENISSLHMIRAVAQSEVIAENLYYTTIVKASRNGHSSFERIYPDRNVIIYSSPEGVSSKDVLTGEVKVLHSSMRDFVEGHQFHWQLFNIANMKSLKLEKRRLFRNCDCIVLSGETSGGSPIEVMVNPLTWLPFGSTLNPDGREHVIEFLYDSWMKKDSLSIFKSLKIYDGDRLFHYSYGDLIFN